MAATAEGDATAPGPALDSGSAPGAGAPPPLACRFEAVVFGCERMLAGPDADPARLRSLIESACGCGLELVAVAQESIEELDGWLCARPAGPGTLVLAGEDRPRLVVVGRHGPDPGAAVAGAQPDPDVWSSIARWLWDRGVAAEQTLSVDCTPRGVLRSGAHGGEPLTSTLEDQIARRRNGELPIVVEDPSWTLVIEGIDARLERAHEALLTLADGSLGTRGSVIVPLASAQPGVLMSGVYTGSGAETRLLPAPRWNTVEPGRRIPGPVRRILDLRSGVLHQRLGDREDRIDAHLFSSLARPATTILRLRGAVTAAAERPLEPSAVRYEQGKTDGSSWIRVGGTPGSIAAAAHERRSDAGDVIDRVAAYEGSARSVADEAEALRRVSQADALGFDQLLCEHRRAWASRWAEADIVIDEDPALQLGVRFALFHLLASSPDRGEAAVGARGLTGNAYRGHVFWDTDVYVLPCLAATHPAAARAILEYRIRRLPAAIQVAEAQRRAGARFPWESALSGRDVTPAQLRDPGGEVVPVRTGELEEHIVADVAWAAACYIDWTGDRAFAEAAGRELFVQTARWWASRIELDEHGHGHIRGVIGPDEYHAPVDDNAFTNVMARWNLRRAAAAAAGRVQGAERRRWLELAQALVDGYDQDTGIYEQFAGFHALEPVRIADLAPTRPIAADLLLGPERTAAAQVVKQADAVMLHYLIPEETAPHSLEPNLAYYEPRTAHGSTLSPGVYAALLARAGQFEQALEWLRLTARIDLEDVGHMTAGGLHLAAMGSLWRAVTFGFLGLRPAGGALAIDPLLPADWQKLEARVRFRGSQVKLSVGHDRVEASADPPVDALTPAGTIVELTVRPQTFERSPATTRSAP